MNAKICCLLLAVVYAQWLTAQISFHGPDMPLSAPVATVPQEQRCVVSGRVMNRLSGETLRKVTLRLTQQGASAGPAFGGRPSAVGYSVTSESDGSFRFENVEPGEYQLEGSRSGYLKTQFGAKGWNRPGTRLTLSPAQKMDGVTLQMNPQAVITGRVVDADGDPVEGVAVSVMKQTWSDGKYKFQPFGFHQTNDLGEYRISGLVPGKYYLMADIPHMFEMANPTAAPSGKPDVRDVKTFYPDAPRIESATGIQLEPGQNASGMDVRLRKSATFHVRGHLTGVLPPGSDISKFSVQAAGKDNEAFFFGGGASNVAKDRSFDIGGIAPGAYDIVATERSGMFHSVASQAIEVGDSDTNDVALQIVAPGRLHGEIRVEGRPPAGAAAVDLSTVRVFLRNDELRIGGPSESKVTESGVLTIENVTPGKYTIHAFGPPHAYLASVRHGQQEMLGKEIDLSQGTAGQLELTFRYGMAELTGTVQNDSSDSSGSDSRPPAMVVVVPEDRPVTGESLKSVSTRQDGSFDLQEVPPGAYRVFAFEAIDASNLQNPDLLKQVESMGKEVSLKETDKQQVQLTLIPADGMQQVYARLGLESE